MPPGQGDTFAGFAILRRLGSGGMGEVYLVEHPRLPRREALKILPGALTSVNDSQSVCQAAVAGSAVGCW